MTKNADSRYGESLSVFISHSFDENDQKLASILQKKLKELGINSYLAEKEKRYGYVISNKIKEAIRECYCVVVILTDHSIISASVNQELGYAMGINRNIIPLVKDEVKEKVGVLLKDIEGEEFTVHNFDEKCKVVSEHISEQQKEIIKSEELPESGDLFHKERSGF